MLALLTHFFAAFCGQNPEHTWAPGGDLLPCCQRCTGLYVGAAVSTLLHAWFKPRLTAPFLGAHGVFLLVIVPGGLYWVPQGPVLRCLSGVLFGFAIATFMRAPLGRTGQPEGALGQARLNSSRAVWAYAAGLGATLCALPLAGAYGAPAVAALVSAVVFCGALSLAVLALACTGLVLLTALNLARGRWLTPRAGSGTGPSMPRR